MNDTQSGWLPEERWLFRLVGSGEPPSYHAAFMGALDSTRMLERALETGVASLAYARLREWNSLASLPPHVVDQLRSAYFCFAAENIRYLGYTRQIFAACRTSNVEVMALRGVAFAERLYEDIALRPMSDIDILVRPDDRSKLERVLTSLGYAPIGGHPNGWANADIIVDLHVDLIGAERIASRGRATRIDMDAVWAAAIKTIIAGESVRTLSWTDSVLTCCLHALKHSCDRLLWFTDLAALVDGCEEEDWTHLVARAQQFGMTKSTYYALSYLVCTLRSPVPASVLLALTPAHVRWMERRCMARVLRGEPAGRFGEVFMLFMMEHRRDRLVFILETLFPKRDVLEQSYGIGGVSSAWMRLRRFTRVLRMGIEVVTSGIWGRAEV